MLSRWWREVLDEVGVDVHGDRDGGVAGRSGTRRAYPVVQRKRCVGVADIVEPDARQAGPLNEPVVGGAERDGLTAPPLADSNTNTASGRHRVRCSARTPVVLCIKVDATARRRCFGEGDRWLSGGVGDGLGDRQPPFVEVDVGPPQAEDLTAAHPGGGQQHERRAEPVPGGGVEEADAVHRASRPARRAIRAGRPDVGDGVGVAQAVADGDVHRLVEHRVDVGDTAPRQTRPVIGQQRGLEPFDVGDGQPGHRELAEGVDDGARRSGRAASSTGAPGTADRPARVPRTRRRSCRRRRR